MKIWKLDSDTDGYCWVTTKDKEEYKKSSNNSYDGTSIQTWTPFEVKKLYGGKMSDMPKFFNPLPIMSSKAIEVLGNLVTDYAQVFPVLPEKLKLVAVNVTNLLDCIDYEKVKAKQLPNGLFNEVTEYAFLPEKVANQHFFKIPEQRRKFTFVSDEFRNRVLSSDLKGFDFIEVWDSEKDPAAEREREERNLQSLLAKIEQEKGEEISFERAYALVQEGYTVRSGKDIMKLNSNKKLLVGTLLPEGEYPWLQMDYFPPIFLEMKWHVLPEMS